MSDWVQDPGTSYILVRIDGEDLSRLNELRNSSGKTNNEVISAALYFLEQSLLYDPHDFDTFLKLNAESDTNDSRK